MIRFLSLSPLKGARGKGAQYSERTRLSLVIPDGRQPDPGPMPDRRRCGMGFAFAPAARPGMTSVQATTAGKSLTLSPITPFALIARWHSKLPARKARQASGRWL